MMLLVLASSRDWQAREFVGCWREYGATLLTCGDLSTAGWRYEPGRPDLSRAVVGGRVIPFDEIGGCLTRLPSVTEDELPQIVAADRGYVAAEMHAFLVAWLSEAAFPVLNRPTPTCLTGPNWRHEQWLHAAARAGMRTHAAVRLITASRGGADEDEKRAPTSVVTVVGRRCLGRPAPALADGALRLAAEAAVESLSLEYRRDECCAEFVGAYPVADLLREGVADAVAEYFLTRGALRMEAR